MKRKCFILVIILPIVVLTACSGEGKAGEPCRETDNAGSRCNGGLICNQDNVCEECGGDDQLCCNSEYIPDCNTGALCDADGRCEKCGTEGAPCCTDNRCDMQLSCNDDNICIACGYENQSCCQGAYCFGTTCVKDGICVKQSCDEAGSCQPCGQTNEPCCEGGICATNNTCGAEGTCVVCGGKGEPACVNQMCGYWQRDMDSGAYTPCECDAWFTNVGGICDVPWKASPQEGIEICFPRVGFADTPILEVNEPSSSDIEHSWWCFWYAAYYKDDPQICENISWGEMREKCAQGENPEDYFAFIKVN